MPAKTKRPRRLSKKPSPIDFVVEHIDIGPESERTWLEWKELRADARRTAKLSGADRVRVFRVKYVLISDTGAKKRSKRG